MDKGKNAKARIQKKILGQIRRAVDDYGMIEEGDKIAVGISGGKDSLTLLIALNALQKFYPKKFELEAITLTLGIGNTDFSSVEELCNNLGIRYTIEETVIGKIVFEEMTDQNPCSLCANLRRGALHNTAKKLGCNKVALGHNKDDAIETLLLSMFYEGRIHSFSPVTYLDRKDIFVIRPLIYSEEKDINGFIKSRDIQVVSSPCPINGITKRNSAKNYLLELQKDIPMVKESIFGAIKRSGLNGWGVNKKI
jgi:tRNA(Ile)-lysidine synthase TilS/MesJ